MKSKQLQVKSLVSNEGAPEHFSLLVNRWMGEWVNSLNNS
jgi:hypothetical protein